LSSDGVGSAAAWVETPDERLARFGEDVHPLGVGVESILFGAEPGLVLDGPEQAHHAEGVTHGSGVEGGTEGARHGTSEGSAGAARWSGRCTSRGVSFADRLRRPLLLAGVKRHPCAQPDVRATEKVACCPELASDPVYKETGWSLPVDFHSFRRAFSTGLAEAGVNAQQAMQLAGHADTRAHSLYVMEIEKLTSIPAAALPQPSRRRIATGIATAPEGGGKNLNDFGAGHEIRTRDPQLGKLMLYQLS
jgi:integrase-like protein